MNFGQAIEELKQGKKVARQGWNGNGIPPTIQEYPIYSPKQRMEYVKSLDLVYILLSNNAVAVCSGCDYEKLKDQEKWTIDSNGYPYYRDYSNRAKTVKLHNFICGKIPKGYIVDHINGNKLDNRRENLRLATYSENNANRKGKEGTSKYKGVSFDKSRNKWISSIQVSGTTYHLGRFDDEIECTKVYDKKCYEVYGEFAKLNFPNEKLPTRMWIVLMPALYLPPYNTQDTMRKVNDRTAKHIGEDKPLDSQPYIAIWTAAEQWQPGWLASQADMLAEDWVVV